MLNRSTGDFDFYPGWFLEPYRAELIFREGMAETQIFVSFVEAKRKEDMNVEGQRRGPTGKFISEWIYYRWFVVKGKGGRTPRGSLKNKLDIRAEF
jgi:hypothetical protein